MIIQFDTSSLENLKENAGKIFTTPEGENVLVQLLELQEKVEKAIDEAEAILEKTALEINPNFSSISGDKIKVFYKTIYMGRTKYRIDETKLEYVPNELYTKEEKIVLTPIKEAIEKYIDERKGELPIGIMENETKKSLKFSLKKNYGSQQ